MYLPNPSIKGKMWCKVILKQTIGDTVCSIERGIKVPNLSVIYWAFLGNENTVYKK